MDFSKTVDAIMFPVHSHALTTNSQRSDYTS